jgi:hypothetical protein
MENQDARCLQFIKLLLENGLDERVILALEAVPELAKHFAERLNEARATLTTRARALLGPISLLTNAPLNQSVTDRSIARSHPRAPSRIRCLPLPKSVTAQSA